MNILIININLAMADYYKYEYPVSIWTPKKTLWNYKVHYQISQTIEELNNKLSRIFWPSSQTWEYIYIDCIISFSPINDNLWKLIVLWILQNVKKVNKILIGIFPWIEDCRTSINMWNNKKEKKSSVNEGWDPGKIISTKA